MNHATARVEECQAEEGNNGQTSSVSEPSAYWFRVYRGIFEHAPIMRDSVWFFMWLIDRTTYEPDRRGLVLGGYPVDDERPARELGSKVKVIRRWRRMLLEGGYILAKRTSRGYIYTILKSKKWQGQCDRPKQPIAQNLPDRPKRAITEEKSQNGRSQVREMADHSVCILNENKAGEESNPAAATAAPSSLTAKSEKVRKEGGVSKEAWVEATLPGPIGTLAFRQGWESAYRERPEDELLSDTMENYIQWCGENGIKPPPPFYDAKRRVEKQEREGESEPDEIARMGSTNTIGAAYAHLMKDPGAPEARTEEEQRRIDEAYERSKKAMKRPQQAEAVA